jgi:hypothetical protein
MTSFRAMIQRELRLSLRGGGDVLTLVLFFVITGAIVPFAVGPDRVLLARIAPGIVWVAAFLAMLLGIERLFRADHEDGSLILLRQAELPLSAVIAAKLIAHWLVSALPLIVASPLLAVLLAMEPDAFWRTLISLLVGTPALAAFRGDRRGGNRGDPARRADCAHPHRAAFHSRADLRRRIHHQYAIGRRHAVSCGIEPHGGGAGSLCRALAISSAED